jgi:hypothetical protein
VQAGQRSILRNLVPQVPYKPARQASFTGSDTIEFVVNGKEGIRLSDALEGKWLGFVGRDDNHLFEGGRLQIILRLQVRLCSTWCTIDF